MDFSPLSPMILIAGGILLILSEIFLFSFFIIWFGISSLVLGIISIYYPFESLSSQLVFISILSMALFFLFAKPLKSIFLTPDEELHDKREKRAVIKNGKVFYEGSFWNYRSDIKLQEKDEVNVVSRDGNILNVTIKTE